MASAQLRLLIPIWQVNNNKVCPIKVVGTFLPKKTLSCNLESKTHSPFLKTFAWRLIRRALAYAERAAIYSTHIENSCSVCGIIETDVHLFFYVTCLGMFGMTPSISLSIC
jgi:hypothetical protein